MTADQLGSFADDVAVMLADLAQLTPDPSSLATLLSKLGYQPKWLGSGLYAPGHRDLARPLALLFPLYRTSSLAVRNRRLVGRHISLSATLAAGLAALRSVERRPHLLFMTERQPLPPGLAPVDVVSLEGGVVPRIWRRCFGRLDILVRSTGRVSHPGSSNTAVNAIEASLPVMQALLLLKGDIRSRASAQGDVLDAPLQPRLTISAAHGGSKGSTLPTVFDILLSRRYRPSEHPDNAIDEIKAVASAAAPASLQIDFAVTDHQPPLPDPETGQRSREERALAAGWGWPQVPFRSESGLIPGSVMLGGLERPDCDPGSSDASTTLDDMECLAATLRALLLDAERPGIALARASK